MDISTDTTMTDRTRAGNNGQNTVQPETAIEGGIIRIWTANVGQQLLDLLFCDREDRVNLSTVQSNRT
jgi:hypothetical protein